MEFAAMEIAAPKCSVEDPGYNIELEDALGYPVLYLIDRVSAAGWSKREAFKALAEVIRNRALAYEENPDPEDAAFEIETSENTAGRLVDAFFDEGISRDER
ncbi:hypothetical protein P6U16_22665 (plasmid) [Rhizobium sp. 32-5/1]|uniref:hypothetical protein n=1 Tax=Rhizobium sp. 32-5/1 TaxID=3019602 RepID=UPI00240CF993|nr:hypothetical protein [Rhizobium sp. 32-5/1]WEZ85822.1 hypothetical protein P6U16_22665 [Rhizobium sp. 32-5/1]